MPKITYISHEGKKNIVEVPKGLSVMEGALQNNIDLHHIVGSGPRGRIVKDDLNNYLNKNSSLSNKSNFINYTYKDEMIGDALVKMYTALKNHKFNVDSPHNPFSYFTTIAFHAFINRIKKEKKHHQTLTDYKEKVYQEEMDDATDGMVYVKPNPDDLEY